MSLAVLMWLWVRKPAYQSTILVLCCLQRFVVPLFSGYSHTPPDLSPVFLHPRRQKSSRCISRVMCNLVILGEGGQAIEECSHASVALLRRFLTHPPHAPMPIRLHFSYLRHSAFEEAPVVAVVAQALMMAVSLC